MDAQAKATVAAQPQAANKMNVMSTSPVQAKEQKVDSENKASRIRGGGAGKDCFIGLVGCFLCFECCEGLCDCFADIICCPCEMLC